MLFSTPGPSMGCRCAGVPTTLINWPNQNDCGTVSIALGAQVILHMNKPHANNQMKRIWMATRVLIAIWCNTVKSKYLVLIAFAQ